jgi:hypothetical protein
MALAPEQLDEVSWQDLTLAARDDMIAASRGRWTHHAPVDPGVTLSELYAWQLDQRFYWIGQVSDSLKRALLALLGGAARGAQPARGVLTLRSQAGAPPSGGARIEAGTVLTHGRGDEALRFAATHDVLWAPLSRVHLICAGRDRTRDLSRGMAVRLWDRAGPPRPPCPRCATPAASPLPSFELSLFVSAPITRRDAPLSLLLDIDAPLVAEGWSPEAIDVDPPGVLRWEVHAGGDWRAIAVDDGTGGLRRAGVLRFELPLEWLGAPGPHRVRATVASDGWTSPPRLRRVVPNVVVVSHEHWIQVPTRRLEWLPTAGHEFALQLDDRAIEVQLELREDGGWQPWGQVVDLAFSGPTDRVFVLDRERDTLRFGDGRNGRAPRPSLDGADNLRGRALVGGGHRGNLPAGNAFAIPNSPSIFAEASADLRWGADPEQLDSALRRHGAALARPQRAVTLLDHEAIARGDVTETDIAVARGVAIARAHAELSYDPRHCASVAGLVSVFVVPHAPRAGTRWVEPPDGFADSAFVAAPRLDVAALGHVREQLETARLAGSEVLVLQPVYRTVHLRVEVQGDADREAARNAIDAALRRYLDPLVGGDAAEGRRFGDPLRPSSLLEVAQRAAAGHRVDSIGVALGGDDSSGACCACCAGEAQQPPGDYESCRETTIEPYALVAVGSIDIRFSRGAP